MSKDNSVTGYSAPMGLQQVTAASLPQGYPQELSCRDNPGLLGGCGSSALEELYEFWDKCYFGESASHPTVIPCLFKTLVPFSADKLGLFGLLGSPRAVGEPVV